ncbi:MAG: hypothetical protein LC633_01840 [Desulfobulbaceae bacterium]|nr:hypothetical protein [Desulfobulbaceae bacterium]
MAGFGKEMTKSLIEVSTIGMTVSFSIFIGVGFGYYLDTNVFDAWRRPF